MDVNEPSISRWKPICKFLASLLHLHYIPPRSIPSSRKSDTVPHECSWTFYFNGLSRTVLNGSMPSPHISHPGHLSVSFSSFLVLSFLPWRNCPLFDIPYFICRHLLILHINRDTNCFASAYLINVHNFRSSFGGFVCVRYKRLDLLSFGRYIYAYT